mgnify:CR=1 FL=1
MILLAVSGGIDSMYLLNRAGDFFPGENFAVAHCNFRLRGVESDGDETFVREWCDSHGIKSFTKRFDTAGYAVSKGISIEMAARELRYRWFARLCRDEGFGAVAIAHNANDNAETLMLNLLRGTGMRGICGMSADSVLNFGDSSVRVIRPILGTGRAEIRQWMERYGLSWREDSTNAENDCQRNIIRNEVFPLFERINPAFLETLTGDMRHFAQAGEVAESYFKESGLNAESIDLCGLMSRPHWKYLLFRLTEGRLNEAQFDDLAACLESGRQIAGKKFGAYIASATELILQHDTTDFTQPHWRIVDRRTIKELKRTDGSLVLDAAPFGGSPVFRRWKEGDWMVPFGMKGRKKLSDIFSDLHWSVPRKRDTVVLEYPGTPSRVAAIVGLKIDDTLRVTDNTTEVIILQK